MASKLRTFGNKVDPEFVVSTFVSSLEDPHNPKHCAKCVRGCVISLAHPTVGLSNYTVLRERYHQYFDTCVNFITVTRSDEENDRLEEEMSVCKCDMSDVRIRRLHDIGGIDGGHNYKGLGHQLAGQVHNALQPIREGDLHEVEKNKQRAAREGKEVPWPATAQDILPNGIETSVAALAVWIEFGMADTIWLGLFATLIDLFKKKIIPPILASPTLPGKFIGISEMPLMLWVAIMEGISSGSRVTPDYVMAQVKRSAVLLKMIGNYFDPDEMKTLNELGVAQFSPEDSTRNFVHVCRTNLQLIPEIAAAVSPYSEAAQDVPMCKESFLAMGMVFHSLLDLPYDEARYGEEIVAASRDHKKRASHPSYTTYQAIMRLWLAERCWAPGCTETYVTAGRAFSACSGCKRVTFCSKTCLTNAWKHEEVPHRAICKKLRYVCEAAGLAPQPQPTDLLLFQVMCVMNKIEDSVLAEITEHMDNLLKHVSMMPKLPTGLPAICSTPETEPEASAEVPTYST